MTSGAINVELPWVADAQRSPALYNRRNPVWGILAICAGLWSLVCMVIGIVLVAGSYAEPGLAGLFVLSMPFWGIVSLGAAGLSIAAVLKKGKFNMIVGWFCLVLAVLTNPALTYSVIVWTQT